MAVNPINQAITEYSVLGIKGVRPIVAEESIKALQAQRSNSTQVKLSSFGQIKSTLSELQTAARGLTDGNKLNTADSAKKSVRKFVSAFNQADQTSRRLTDPGSRDRAAGALAGNERAQQVSRSLQQGLARAGNTGTPSLASIGITQNKDGSVAFNDKKFEQAFNADKVGTTNALKQLGDRLDRTATQALGDNGAVGGSIDKLREQEREQKRQDSRSADRIDDLNRRFAEPLQNYRASQALQSYSSISAL